jgi:hypothetical protein
MDDPVTVATAKPAVRSQEGCADAALALESNSSGALIGKRASAASHIASIPVTSTPRISASQSCFLVFGAEYSLKRNGLHCCHFWFFLQENRVSHLELLPWLTTISIGFTSLFLQRSLFTLSATPAL